MSRQTYIFTGPPGSADVVMGIIQATMGRAFTYEAGSQPYVRADPVAVYVGGHDFDDGDIDTPDGTPVALKTGYPVQVEVNDIERDRERQEDVAARIFDAIRADGRLRAVYIDDMQHVLDVYSPGASPASG